MKITLDQQALAQAVTSHLRNVGVTADIVGVEFRYTRTPYTVFAEVELSEARVKVPKIPSSVQEKEVVVPEPAAAPQPIVDPDNLPPLEKSDDDSASTEVPSLGPASPLFSSGE